MITKKTGNSISNYNLRKPITKSKHMPEPIITNYALILLKVIQDDLNSPVVKGYSKKELVADALGHLHDKYKFWHFSDAAFCSEFASFNHNNLLFFNRKTKRWYPGINLLKYFNYHFGLYSAVPISSPLPYDEAVDHNTTAQILWDKKKNHYKKMKKIHAIQKEFFFQD